MDSVIQHLNNRDQIVDPGKLDVLKNKKKKYASFKNIKFPRVNDQPIVLDRNTIVTVQGLNSLSPRMNTIASYDEFKPIRMG